MKKYYKLLLLLPIALYQAGGLMAQNAEDEESVFELSPFMVDESADIGYSATSTLAGTRLKTNLRDIGASISIINQEFLEDTASDNLMDVLLFTPNTEVSGPGGNFSGYQSSAGSLIPEGESDRPNGGNTRIRGLASADLTRDYFITDVPFDTFNVDRIAVQRGANSALFGIGSPGGIVNNTTVRANLFDTGGRIRFRTDEHGSLRGSFRYNQILIEDRLSILAAGLYEDKKYGQEEAYGEDERIYVSLNWKINDNLRFHASFESGDRSSANPDHTPPNDGITPWIEMGKPISMGGAQGSDLWRGSGDIYTGKPNNNFLDLAGPGSSSGFVSYFDTDSAEPFFGGNTFVRRGRGAPGGTVTGEMMLFQPRTREDIIRRSGLHPNGGPVEPGTGGFFASGFVATQITDRSIFDYQKHLYTGGAHSQDSDWDIFQASLEGTWWDEKVGFELAAFDQSQFSKSSNPLQGLSQRTIYIDPNMYLIDTQNGQADGSLVANPHFGKPVIGGWWQGNNLSSDRESTRATAFIDLHAEDFMESGLVTRILGSLRITGLWQEREVRSLESYGRYKIDPDAVVAALEGDTPLSFATIRTGSIFELPHNEGIDYLNINSLSDLKGANIGAVPFGQQRDRPVVNGNWTGWSESQNAFVDFNATTFNMDDNNNFPASFFAGKGLEKLISKVVVAQQNFWDNSLIVMGSWRNDRLRSTSLNAPGGVGITREGDLVNDPTFVAGPQASDLTEDADEDSTSWSATWHMTDMLGDFLGEGNDFSVYMSESDNFQPSAGRVTILNDTIDNVIGSTTEKGIIFSAMDGMLTARLNWFETGILNNSFDGGGVSANEGILLNLARQLDNPENVAQGFTAADAQAVLPPQGVIDLNEFVPDFANFDATTNRNSGDTGTQDFTAEGNELEIVFNPNSNWTMLLSVAKQETVLSNIYPVLRNYVQDFVIPNWVESSFAQNYFIDEDGTETLSSFAQRNIVDPVAESITQEGIPSIEQRKYRVSLNTSYRFGRNDDMIPDFLGDFTIGGGYRWEDRAGVSFGVTQNEFGNNALDPSNPFYAPRQDFVDLFFRSEYQLSDKYNLTVQLNIKDLFDNNDLVPIYVNPDTTKIYRFLPGRLITLSGTLEF